MTQRARPRSFVAVALAVVLAMIASACGDDDDAALATTTGEAASVAGATGAVEALDDVFGPTVLTVAVGATVTFTNNGRNEHDVVLAAAAEGVDGFGVDRTAFAPKGGTYSYRFASAGTFAYYCSIHGSSTAGMTGTVIVGDAGAESIAATTSATDATDTTDTTDATTGGVVRVPEDAETIQAAVSKAAEGDLILIAPGEYHESVTVETPHLTIRGLDRNEVVVDGDFALDNGFKILADGVAVENLTVRNFTENGVFWNGVTGYRASYVTVYRNGDYGIYAFDSYDGQFEHSHASGSPDAGFYIGGCYPCNAVVTDVIAEYNGLGYSGTNAGGKVVIANSVWRHNRAGIVPNSGDYEPNPPARENVIVGNLVYDNGDPTAPAIEIAGVVHGNGILVAGAVDIQIIRNRVIGHEYFGITLVPYLDENTYLPQRNIVRDNVISESGIADLSMAANPDAGNCFAGNDFSTSLPRFIERDAPCAGGEAVATEFDGAIDFAGTILAAHPPSTDYKISPVPPAQAQMPGAATAPARPATDVPEPIDINAIDLPAAPDDREPS